MDQYSPVLIITARGSTEPASGSRLLTPIARSIVRNYPGDGRIQSLVYPATFESFEAAYPARLDLGDSPAIGVRNLISVLQELAKTDEGRQFVLLGWSQGAQVITDSLVAPQWRHAGYDAPGLEASAADRIAAVALFGNPTFTAGQSHNAGEFTPGVSGVSPYPHGVLDAFAGRIRDYCAAGDISAQNAPDSGVEGHVAYFENGMPEQAAQFVLSRLLD